MKAPHFSVPLSQSQVEILGRICVSWAQLEFLVELGLLHYKTHSLLSLPRDIKVKLTELQKSVEVKVTNKTHRVTMIGYLNRARVAADKRNLAVHGKWSMDVESKEPVAVSWFGIVANDPLKQLFANELIPLDDEIAELTHAFQAFLTEQNAFGIFASVYAQSPSSDKQK